MDYNTYIALMACLHEHRGGASRENLMRWDANFHELDEGCRNMYIYIVS